MKTERPKEAIVKKKTFRFRLNRMRTNIFNFFNREKLEYTPLDKNESLQLLLKTRKSYIRFGNGESEILSGLDMATQVYDKELQKALERIIHEYSPDCNYMLGLVNWALTMSVEEMQSKPEQNLFHIWKFMRYIFHKFEMNKINMPFLEADMFRIGQVELPPDQIEQLWADRSSIIMVYNNEDHFRRFREKHSDKEVYFIEIPDRDFFVTLPEVQEKIQMIIKDNAISRDSLVVLVAAGPGSNVLCYNLCQRDDSLLCYDIGNFFHMRYPEEQQGSGGQGVKGSREKD
jgi:hypothetical protein